MNITVKAPLLNSSSGNRYLRAVFSSYGYMCCGGQVLSGFESNPFNKISFYQLTLGKQGYHRDVIIPIELANKLWEWPGWEPTTWNKLLIENGFEIKAVFEGSYDNKPTHLIYYSMNIVKGEDYVY